LLAKALCQSIYFLMVYISIPAVTATGGFALTATHFFSNAKKSKQKRLALSVRPLAEARRSFAPAFIRGHRPPVGFAGTCMRWVRLRRTALRAHPRVNTSTQPAEGAGGSKAKAKAKANANASLRVSVVCTLIRQSSSYRVAFFIHQGAGHAASERALSFSVEIRQG
jgi:hypothetical protein